MPLILLAGYGSSNYHNKSDIVQSTGMIALVTIQLQTVEIGRDYRHCTSVIIAVRLYNVCQIATAVVTCESCHALIFASRIYISLLDSLQVVMC